jgi:hypothetical protein
MKEGKVVGLSDGIKLGTNEGESTSVCIIITTTPTTTNIINLSMANLS